MTARSLLLACALALTWSAPRDAAADPKTEAAALSHVAHGKATAGQWQAAGDLYLQAYRTDPSVLGYLSSAATSFFKAERWRSAADAYNELLTKLDDGDERRVKARERLALCNQRLKKAEVADAKERAEQQRRQAQQRANLARIQRENAALKAAKQRAEAAAKAAQQRQAAHQQASKQRAIATTRRWSYVTAGLGLAAAAGGGYLAWSGMADGEALEADLRKLDSDGKIIGVTAQEARDRQAAANARIISGYSVAAVGAGMIGWAAWSLLRAPKAVSLRPTFGGALLRVAF